MRFFLDNPRIAESLEGIARWRLRDELIRRTVNEINEALDWLVAEKFLDQYARTAVAVFSLNRAREADAWRFVDLPEEEL